MNRYASSALLIATLACPIASAQQVEDELGSHGPRDAPGMERARSAPQIEQVSPQVENMQRMQRLLLQHLRTMQEQLRLIRAASPSLGVAMVSNGDASGTGETVVFAEEKLCPGSASVHKLIIDHLSAVEMLLQHIFEREAVQSGVVPNE